VISDNCFAVVRACIVPLKVYPSVIQEGFVHTASLVSMILVDITRIEANFLKLDEAPGALAATRVVDLTTAIGRRQPDVHVRFSRTPCEPAETHKRYTMLRRAQTLWVIPGERTSLRDPCSTVFAVDSLCCPEDVLFFEDCAKSISGDSDSVTGNLLPELENTHLSKLLEGREAFRCVTYKGSKDHGVVSGVNENGVAVALKFAATRPMGTPPEGQVTGECLTFLALRFGKTALHAAQLLSKIVDQLGVKAAARAAGTEWSPGFVLVDAHGAWLLETASGFWALSKTSKEICLYRDQLYIEEPLTYSTSLESLVAVGSSSSASGRGRINFRMLFHPTGAESSRDLNASVNRMKELKSRAALSPLDLASLIQMVREHDLPSSVLPEASDTQHTIRAGAFISVLTPDAPRRFHLFTCEHYTECAMFKPIFLDRAASSQISTVHASYLGETGTLHRRRRYALERKRLDLERTTVRVLQYRDQEERRCAYQPADICERLRFLEMICVEKALSVCGYSTSFMQAEHAALCRGFEQRLLQMGKKYFKMDTKMLYPTEVSQKDWPDLFQRYAEDTKESLFEKTLMREEYEYELFMLDGGDPLAQARRIRGLQLAPSPGEHFCMPIVRDIPEQPDASMPHVYVYKPDTRDSANAQNNAQ